jgi:cysteine synthase
MEGRGTFACVSSCANVYVAFEEVKKYKDKKTIVINLYDSINEYIIEERFVT